MLCETNVNKQTNQQTNKQTKVQQTGHHDVTFSMFSFSTAGADSKQLKRQ
jgi:hypothetical protein